MSLSCNQGKIALQDIITEVNKKLDTVAYLPDYNNNKSYPPGTLIERSTVNGKELIISQVQTTPGPYKASEWSKVDHDTLASLVDTNITNPTDKDILSYDLATKKWLSVASSVVAPTQEQANWAEGDNTKVSFIKGKPDVYTKSTIDTKLGKKADKATTYTKTVIDGKFSSIPSALAKDILLTGYAKPGSTGPLAVTDTVNKAFGKLEKKLDAATAGGGDKNVQSSWTETDNTKDDFIKDKPTIPVVDKASIDALGINAEWIMGHTVATNVPAGAVFTDTHGTGADILLKSYVKPSTGGAIGTNDKLNIALGKLEYKIEHATQGSGDKNVQSDWTEADTNSDAFIKHKPTLATPAQLNQIATNTAGVSTNAGKIATTNTSVTKLQSQVGTVSIKKLTQAQYDGLGTKDTNTLYVIVG